MKKLLLLLFLLYLSASPLFSNTSETTYYYTDPFGNYTQYTGGSWSQTTFEVDSIVTSNSTEATSFISNINDYDGITLWNTTMSLSTDTNNDGNNDVLYDYRLDTATTLYYLPSKNMIYTRYVNVLVEESNIDSYSEEGELTVRIFWTDTNTLFEYGNINGITNSEYQNPVTYQITITNNQVTINDVNGPFRISVNNEQFCGMLEFANYNSTEQYITADLYDCENITTDTTYDLKIDMAKGNLHIFDSSGNLIE